MMSHLDMSVSCELCRQHLGEVLEAELRQASSHLIVAPPTSPQQPEIAPVNGLSIVKGDAELSAAELEALKIHVAQCAQCTEQLRQMRIAHQLLAALPAHSAPSDLRQRVRTQLTTDNAAQPASVLAAAPARNNANGDNLWQRTQRGWENLWQRPARTAWMGGSLALGALGILLLVRLPEWSTPQNVSETMPVAAQNQNAESAANGASDNSAVTVVPKSAAPTAKPDQTSKPDDKRAASVTPPVLAPAPNFPTLPSDNAPSSFTAPPLPNLPPVRRVTPKMPDPTSKSNVGKAPGKTPNVTLNKAKTNVAPKATAAGKNSPSTAAPAATMTTPSGESRKSVAPTIARAREVEREVIELSVAPLSSASANANSRSAAASQGPRAMMAPPSVGGFMSNSKSTRNADSTESAESAAGRDASSAGDAPQNAEAPNARMRVARPAAAASNQMAVAKARSQVREVIIEVTPPRDLSKARLLVTLAPDWQFSDAVGSASEIKDTSLQREVWQGNATADQAVRVTLSIQPHFTLADDNKGGELSAGRTPLMVELWDLSSPTRKLVASRRLELPADNAEQADTTKKTPAR